MNNETEKQIVRLDKNFAYNILDFDKFDNDAKLIKDLLFYISFSYQNHTDLFGFGLLDPKKFANTMSINYYNLFLKHPKPYQFYHLNSSEIKRMIDNEKKFGRMSEYHLWSSYLENTLYILNKKPVFSFYKHKTEKNTYIEEKSIILFENIGITSFSKKGQKKFYYRYKLNNIFLDNLKKYFLNTELKTYISLKKPKLEDFFLTINNIIQNQSLKKINSYYFKFNELAKLLHISTENVNEKYRISDIKKKISSKMKKITTFLTPLYKNFEFSWLKGKGQRYAYVPAIFWVIDDKNINCPDKKIGYSDIFRNDLRHELLSFFRYNYQYNFTENTSTEANNFFSWLTSEQNIDEKTALFITVYSRYNKTSSRFYKPTNAADDFFKNLKNVKSVSGLQEFLNNF